MLESFTRYTNATTHAPGSSLPSIYFPDTNIVTSTRVFATPHSNQGMTSVNDGFTTIATIVVVVIIIVVQKFELLYSGGNFDNVKPTVM